MSGVVEGGDSTAEETAAKAVNKRYEGLVTVRNKAVKGKGAWYWAHLEPLLVRNNDNGVAKAVKLKCCLCDTVFSASNPSRTASEHLKRGTCPNFSSTGSGTTQPLSPQLGSGVLVKVESQAQLGQVQCLATPLSGPTSTPHYNHRKRSSSSSSTGGEGGGMGGGGGGGSVVVSGNKTHNHNHNHNHANTNTTSLGI